jgi:hypothetical protein
MEQPLPNLPTITPGDPSKAPKAYDPYTDPLTVWKLGRPYKYGNISEVQGMIDTYLLECDATGKIPNVSGLALALWTTRKGLCEWERLKAEEGDEPDLIVFKSALRNAISRAKERIAEWWTPGLMDRDKARGTEFYLKTLGYQDRPEPVPAGNITINQQNNVLVGNPAQLTDLFGGILPNMVKSALDKPA